MNKKKKLLIIDVSVVDNIENPTGIQRVVNQYSQIISRENKNFNLLFLNSQRLKIFNYENYLNHNIPTKKRTSPLKEKNLLKSVNGELILLLRTIFLSIPALIFKLISHFLPRKKFLIISIISNIFLCSSLFIKIISLKRKYEITFLLLDSSWTLRTLILSFFFRLIKSKIISIFYDLSPIKYPQYFEETQSTNFLSFWKYQFFLTTQIFSISNSISNELKEYLKNTHLQAVKYPKLIEIILKKLSCQNNLDFYDYIKLGNNLSKISSLEIKRNNKKYIVVGSIEPRKDISYIIDEFDKLWNKGIDVSLTLVYSNSWKSDLLINRIYSHEEFNSRLFVEFRISDSELSLHYQSSYALINSSIYEGYGLNVGEALLFGCKVFSNKIDVINEIYTDSVIYFDKSKIHLSDKIIQDMKEGIDLKTYKPISWDNATRYLINKIYP